MPSAADAFLIVLAVVVVFFAVSIPQLGDAVGRLLGSGKRADDKSAPAADGEESGRRR